jgi:hypothetical protein
VTGDKWRVLSNTEPITRILAGKLVSLGQPSETCS